VKSKILIDYVYLDSEERKRFAQASHEYLIEQLQFTGSESVTSSSSKFRLNFNHPCKALYWNVQQNQYLNGNSYLAYNPKDWYQTAVNATKRAALSYGTLDISNGVFVARPVISGNSVATTFASRLSSARVAYVDISSNTSPAIGDRQPTLTDLIVLGPVLTDDLISIPTRVLTSYFPSPFVRAVSGDGSASSDVFVQQYDNYGIFLNGKVNPCSQVLLQLNLML
jgi:hypothetical protein